MASWADSEHDMLADLNAGIERARAAAAVRAGMQEPTQWGEPAPEEPVVVESTGCSTRAM